jgi:hypothetical protein
MKAVAGRALPDRYSEISARLQSMASRETAAVLQRFFKTGVGQ